MKMRAEKTKLKKAIARYKGARGALLPVLQEVQRRYNYLPAFALKVISQELGISRSTIYGLVTFYAQFSLKERGKYIIRLCEGTACHVRGSHAIRETVKKTLGLENDGTTVDKRFTLQTVACLGTCFLAPVMMVNSAYYGGLTISKALAALKELK